VENRNKYRLLKQSEVDVVPSSELRLWRIFTKRTINRTVRRSH